MTESAVIPRLDLSKPQFDQGTYMGRAKHFFIVTNPLNLLKSPAELEQAKEIVQRCRSGDRMPELSDEQIWKAKYIYDSAYHPDTGEKMLLVGRMSAQVPMNMSITGCMLTFYKTTPQTVFWQWINQTFNAVVNYTNRSGDEPISTAQLGISYCLATGGAVGTALFLNSMVKRFPPVVGRFVPFCAVAAANCINIPFMRNREIREGIPVTDEAGRKLGDSKVAARSAIPQVVFSRICMAAPGMFIPPIIMNQLEKKAFMKKFPLLNAPIQVALVGFFLIFATPMACAVFPQQSSLKLSSMEEDIQLKAKELGSTSDHVFFNKGL